jgi:flagellar hook protein FlgE
VSDGQQQYYTRAGNFQLDAVGNLVAGNGFIVQGRMATDGVMSDKITDVRVPLGQKSPARATTSIIMGGNLDARAAEGATRQTSITVFDSLGRGHELRVTFTKDETGWTYEVHIDEDDTPLYSGALTFSPTGRLEGPETIALNYSPEGAEPMEMELVFGAADSLEGLTQFGGTSTAVLREQDGYTMGELERIGIDPSGKITGSFTNGVTLDLAQIILADFNNPSGLYHIGSNMFTISPNSGPAVLGYAGEGSRSMITSGALEMSNVDLAQEFTSMITAQRGFQSNARVITASDDMLQELVNIKR